MPHTLPDLVELGPKAADRGSVSVQLLAVPELEGRRLYPGASTSGEGPTAAMRWPGAGGGAPKGPRRSGTPAGERPRAAMMGRGPGTRRTREGGTKMNRLLGAPCGGERAFARRKPTHGDDGTARDESDQRAGILRRRRSGYPNVRGGHLKHPST